MTVTMGRSGLSAACCYSTVINRIGARGRFDLLFMLIFLAFLLEKSVALSAPQISSETQFSKSTPRSLTATHSPTSWPTSAQPTLRPTTPRPTLRPVFTWTSAPSQPTLTPTHASPSVSPSVKPSHAPSQAPIVPRKFPSVLLILADDMDYGDIGYQGSFTYTPTLDALASSQNSLRLDNFHSGSSICSPARASFLSGRNPERDCVTGALMSTNDTRYISREDMPSIARYARDAGYTTAFFGKWHLFRGPFYFGK